MDIERATTRLIGIGKSLPGADDRKAVGAVLARLGELETEVKDIGDSWAENGHAYDDADRAEKRAEAAEAHVGRVQAAWNRLADAGPGHASVSVAQAAAFDELGAAIRGEGADV